MNLKTLSLLHKISKKIVRSAKDFELFVEKMVAKKAGQKYLNAVIEKCKEIYKVDEVEYKFEMSWDSWSHVVSVQINEESAKEIFANQRQLTHWLVDTTYPHQQFFSIRHKYTQD
jgi:hypothetical protein